MPDLMAESQPKLRVSMRDLDVRLARSAGEVDAAQALRYRVFYDEMAARPSDEAVRCARDWDQFDQIADHLLVLDRNRGDGPNAVVGTYRLIRRSAADRLGGFYTSAEYDITPILAHPGEILELGRSCVDVAYRTSPTMQMLWRGIAEYVAAHDIALMFGCGSLQGIDPDALSQPLSYLYHHHLAPPALRPTAVPERFVEMARLPQDALQRRAAIDALPPLIKGYLRLGGFVGDGAVIDHQFNTTDVCIVVKTDLITRKYARHYERTAGWAERVTLNGHDASGP